MGICKCPDGYQLLDHAVVYCKLVHLSVFDLAMTDTHGPFWNYGTGSTGTAMFPFISCGISIIAFRVRVRVRVRSRFRIWVKASKDIYSCDQVKSVLGLAGVRVRARVRAGS